MDAPAVQEGVRVALRWRTAYFQANVEQLGNTALRKFYERQNQLIERYVAVPADHCYLSRWQQAGAASASLVSMEETTDLSAISSKQVSYGAMKGADQETRFAVVEDGDRQRLGSSPDPHVQRAIVASNVANLLLLLGQIYAYIATQSLALLANAVDAVLDFLSGIIIGLTWYVRQYGGNHSTRYRYPVGRARLESIGVIIMAVLMTALTLNVLTESLTALAKQFAEPERAPTSLPLSREVLALSVSFCIVGRLGKMLIVALATDHWNDCLSNTGALSAAAMAKWWPAADPLGGTLISCFILRNWWRLTSRHLDQFMSRSASSSLHSVVTFAALWHDSRIRAIDRVCLYHVGPACFAEVDIVLDPNMPLSVCHDIGESLQARIECLPDVERCFVHLDFETAHRTDVEHQWPV
ncbi:hypothetical protein F1559_001925 [Cyanidiococcus yangmingshanensis]|uniref:Cation efflux protein transmembrane domain-containing protein n=1 Tax=Cyanidiococcus yangmingshanensis TaxID=2690220 RepID=A0A7J7IFR1_9RHOD|nr:hypothetical protein F1559_001925 [Cyanidiococcus yangmingshanensis]